VVEHEFGHVPQYEQFGLGFIYPYAASWSAAGYSYFNMSMEREADANAAARIAPNQVPP
jgi:hypothetical protein